MAINKAPKPQGICDILFKYEMMRLKLDVCERN
jgi:hypothetical protein